MSDYDDATSILKNNHWYKPNVHLWQNPSSTDFINESSLAANPKIAIAKVGLDWNQEMRRLNSAYQVPANSITKKYGIPYVDSWDDADNYTTEVIPKGCQHEWLDYTGLAEQFKYCKKCNKKDEQNNSHK